MQPVAYCQHVNGYPEPQSGCGTKVFDLFPAMSRAAMRNTAVIVCPRQARVETDGPVIVPDGIGIFSPLFMGQAAQVLCPGVALNTVRVARDVIIFLLPGLVFSPHATPLNL